MKNILISIATLLIIGALCLIIIKNNTSLNQPASVPLYPIGAPVVPVNPEVSTAPYGIFVTVGSTWSQPIPNEVFLNPSVNGIVTHVRWDIIESNTTQGLYDWSVIDTDFANAVAHGKDIEIDFSAGRYTPLYLYNAPYNVPKIYLTTGNGTCTEYTIFWHPAVITAYTNIINAMAAHINEHPDWKAALKTVTFLAANDSTSELRIALEQGAVPNPVCGESISYGNTNEAWKAMGYRPSKAFEANNAIFDAVKNAFPDELFKIFPIPSTAFPPIKEDGTIVPASQKVLSDEATQTIINNAIQKFGAQNMIVGWTALNATNGSVPLVDAAVAQGATRRYQLEYRKYGDLDCLAGGGVSPCDEVDFKAALDNAFARGARVVEVFADDVMAYPNALAYAKPKFDVYKPAVVPSANFIPRGNGSDTAAPSAPGTPTASNITTSSVNLSWSASTDNVGVTSYDIYKNGVVTMTVTTNSATVTNLASGTSYTFTIKAKDLAGNVSAASGALTASTITGVDTTKPVISIITPQNNSTIPINTTVAITVNATDNVKVTRLKMYYKPGSITICDKPNPTTPTYTCNMSTSYVTAGTYARTIYVQAYDAAGNMTEVSRNVTIQ